MKIRNVNLILKDNDQGKKILEDHDISNHALYKLENEEKYLIHLFLNQHVNLFLFMIFSFFIMTFYKLIVNK